MSKIRASFVLLLVSSSLALADTSVTCSLFDSSTLGSSTATGPTGCTLGSSSFFHFDLTTGAASGSMSVVQTGLDLFSISLQAFVANPDGNLSWPAEVDFHVSYSGIVTTAGPVRSGYLIFDEGLGCVLSDACSGDYNPTGANNISAFWGSYTSSMSNGYGLAGNSFLVPVTLGETDPFGFSFNLGVAPDTGLGDPSQTVQNFGFAGFVEADGVTPVPYSVAAPEPANWVLILLPLSMLFIWRRWWEIGNSIRSYLTIR